MAFRFIAVAPCWLIAVRSGPGRLRAVSGTESARAAFPANKASSRSALPVAEAARAGAARKAECLRLPPHTWRIPVQPIASLGGRPDRRLAGLTDRWRTQSGREGIVFGASVMARQPETSGTARLLRLWRPPQPAIPPDTGPVMGESPAVANLLTK
jgi:hypothetical protein